MPNFRRRPWRAGPLVLALLALIGAPGLCRAAPAGAAPAPAPLGMISRDAPAFTSDDCGGAYPAALANNASYADTWRSCAASPSPARPVWLAYDLSRVPAAQRTAVLLVWYNSTTNYDHTVVKTPAYNIPRDYTIEANPAPGGGAPPQTGWTTLTTGQGNTYHSRQHLLALGASPWVRFLVTATDGSERNADVALNLDIHDASRGVEDDWIFFGDSITDAAMGHDGASGATFAQRVNARLPAAFPAQEDGGIGYLTGDDGARLLGGWLALFPGRYVVIGYGTNDANGSAPGDPALAGRFRRNEAAMIEAVLAAGKVPIVPTIPWARTPNVQANGPALNAVLADLTALYPRLVRGPDLWAAFRDRPDLIGPDGLHPTTEGSAAFRQQWADWAVATVYGGLPDPSHCFAATGNCVGDRFFASWQAHGGLAINGYPLSDVFTETLDDGRPYQVQYFERVRMEWHPENADPQYQVLLGQFGRRIHPADPPGSPIPGATYFEQTGHNVTRAAFLDFWVANGGLAQFGLPISEELTETLDDGKVYTVQYFERARFEWHPENADPHFQVLLGQFGRQILGSR